MVESTDGKRQRNTVIKNLQNEILMNTFIERFISHSKSLSRGTYIGVIRSTSHIRHKLLGTRQGIPTIPVGIEFDEKSYRFHGKLHPSKDNVGGIVSLNERGVRDHETVKGVFFFFFYLQVFYFRSN